MIGGAVCGLIDHYIVTAENSSYIPGHRKLAESKLNLRDGKTFAASHSEAKQGAESYIFLS
jgi:hypothetical protein